MGERRVPALDGVRGLAILLVLGYHLRVMPGGWVGVDVFFALSGYLITTLLLGEQERTGAVNLRSFYRRRVARLAPALLLALLGMWVLWTAMAPGDPRPTFNVIVTLLYVTNVARALWYWQMTPAAWAWSLSVEEQFYMLWPPLFRRLIGRLGRQRLAGCLVGLAVVLQVTRGLVGGWNVDYVLLRGDDLMLGAALALVPVMLSRLATVAVLAGLVVMLVGVPWGTNVSITLGAWVSVALVAGHQHIPGIARLRQVGRISYSLYLWNGVMTLAVLPVNPLVQVGLQVVLAVASTLLIEEPLRRRLAHKRARPTGVAAGAVVAQA
jgi:peptidoglycan/LPS O-acetylase OafA/YrhL